MLGKGRQDGQYDGELNPERGGEPQAGQPVERNQAQGRWTRWQALLVVGVVIDLLLMGYVVYLLWNKSNSPTLTTVVAPPPATPTQVSVELWNAYGEALLAARKQAEDATLVSAATQWQEVDENVLLDGTPTWSFVFYSPSSHHSFDIVVNGKKTQVVNEVELRASPRVMPVGGWRSGPNDALLVFLAYSGRAFLGEHPQSIVNLHLGKHETGRTVWSIVALDPQDKSVYSLLIDTETMQVLSSSAWLIMEVRDET
ncbi:MAG TPA: hypothetical protein ENN99_15110 [Chloroflexi bacterium]|nr:hypothetical protein [Chloroflexota bacterium]